MIDETATGEWSNKDIERKLRLAGKTVYPTSKGDSLSAESLDAHYERYRSGAGEEPDFAELISDEQNHPTMIAMETAKELLASACSYIVDASNARLVADQIAFASGMYIRMGISITDLAKKHGISKQAFSKGCIKFTQQLEIEPSRGMKKNTQNYGKRNHRNTKTK